MKHIRLIPAAALSAASLVTLSLPVFAQVPAILKKAHAAARVPIFTEHAKAVRSIHSARDLTYLAGYNLQFLKTPYKGAFRPGGVLPNSSASLLQRTEARIKTERQVHLRQKRLVWQVGLSRFRSEILAGFQLPENFIEAYYFRRILPYLAKPYYTPETNGDSLYRGMLLTPEELAKILQTGFSPASSTWNTGTDGRPAISFSSSKTEAMHYIFQHNFKKDAVGVVFEIRRTVAITPGQNRRYNSNGTIYYSYENVPADDIVNVFLRGEYSLEPLEQILQKAKEGKITPHEKWTNQFDGIFSR